MPEQTTIEPVVELTPEPETQEVSEQITPEQPNEVEQLKKQIEELQTALNDAKATTMTQKDLDALMTLKLQEAAAQAQASQPAKQIKWVK